MTAVAKPLHSVFYARDKPMPFMRSARVRPKPKLTLRSFSELLNLRAPASDEKEADGNVAERAVLAQRIVCAMRRGDDKEAEFG